MVVRTQQPLKARSMRFAMLMLAATLLPSACSSTGPLLRTPDVRLDSVAIDQLGFNRQTFLLGFSVSNPNPFPLPVKNVQYEVLLDDARFASGTTASNFLVAANGDGDFAISVELDLMQSASGFNSLLKNGFDQIVTYELRGSLGVDIPFARPVPFVHSGTVQLGAGSY
jgi:LEA14-like dessication related protein